MIRKNVSLSEIVPQTLWMTGLTLLMMPVKLASFVNLVKYPGMPRRRLPVGKGTRGAVLYGTVLYVAGSISYIQILHRQTKNSGIQKRGISLSSLKILEETGQQPEISNIKYRVYLNIHHDSLYIVHSIHTVIIQSSFRRERSKIHHH